MTEAIALGEKLLALLDESARTTTYKPALLLALIDRVQEHMDTGVVPVRDLAERVIELYWPQTRPYATTGTVLRQSNTGRALIVSRVTEYRERVAPDVRALPEAVRRREDWDALVDAVELSLAEWPVPRLQKPFAPFLYGIDWDWEESGRWSARKYRESSRSLRLHPGTASSLVALGPLFRPFITRWWTDKAAQLNPDVEDARSVIEFEDFLFGHDRKALGRVAEGLLDLQQGCFYCSTPIGTRREVDHFVPWAFSGDDGLDNLVVACHRCNNDKRATLAGPQHLQELLTRNQRWAGDLASLADERLWPRHPRRSSLVRRSAYLDVPVERSLWSWFRGAPMLSPVVDHRDELKVLLASNR